MAGDDGAALLVAKELLNPADSVLIVTIDEKEYLRLGLLLEQVFPEAQIQMVSNRDQPKGVAQARRVLSSRRSISSSFVLAMRSAASASEYAR